MKKNSKKLRLNVETLRHLDMTQVKGGDFTVDWPCPAPTPVTRAFTGCEYCESYSSDEDG